MHDSVNGLDPELSSMENIKRTDGFPPKKLISEDDSLRVPFPLLNGESAEFLGRTTDGIIVLSNFRLLIRYKESFSNVPLGLIEGVEVRDIFHLYALCKDATVVRCSFPTNEACQEWYKRLTVKLAPCKKLEDVFAYSFHAWCADKRGDSDTSIDSCNQTFSVDADSAYSFTKEIERMKFDLNKAWRYTEINRDFSLCPSYPSEHIIPKSVSDENLRRVAGFRALRRFPSVVWRNKKNGAVLVRSSQPEMGFFGWRNDDDENLLNAIPLACAMNPGEGNSRDKTEVSAEDERKDSKKMLIMDCRSYSAASANRLKGGGVECSEYYQSCEVQFMNLANIHTIRKNYLAFRTLCSSNPDQASWLSSLEKTNWLHYISSLLRASVLAVSSIDKEGKPVLVHCSDGWDRTPQIVSLAELMLDPYYRTKEGFKIIVEREWLEFGHKFADRCGNGAMAEDLNERCPVFLQWLDCVNQVLSQFPCEFEFNEAYLIKLVHHTYSNLFGTFLCNTVQERKKEGLLNLTASVWGLLKHEKFNNHLYAPSQDHEVIYPVTHVQNLLLWKSVYLSNNSSVAGPEDASTAYAPSPTPDMEPTGLQKTRSCDDITSLSDELTSSLGRRKSDPNIATDHGEQQAQKLLTHAIDGDTSCSSESVKSSDNNVSVSESGETLTEVHSDMGNTGKEVVQNGVVTDSMNYIPDATDGGGETSNSDTSNTSENGLGDTQSRICNGEIGNGYRNDELEVDEHSENGHKENGHPVNGMIENGHQINHINGVSNGIHERNGHSNGNHDFSESSENSIETISENEDNSDKDHVENGDSLELNGSSNGVDSETNKSCNSRDSSSHLDSIDNIAVMKIRQRAIYAVKSEQYLPSLESSTDTVTEDLQNGENPFTAQNGRGVQKVESLCTLCDKATISLQSKYREQMNSISTSTSDLTDPCILDNVNSKFNSFSNDSLLNVPDKNHASLKLCCILAQGGLNGNNGAYSGISPGISTTPPIFATPVSPQSRNSTCPPTPGTSGSEGKSLDSSVPRHQTGVSRHLDADGLTTFRDPVQQQIQKLCSKYEQQLSAMREENSHLRLLLAQHASTCNGEGLCNPDYKLDLGSPGSCDMHSIQSTYSNPASDASWDQMDDPEVNITRWVPDHMVNSCAGCDNTFTMLKRKHHCRNCGLIFCHNCCKETVPLPHQMIHTNERVCDSCYNKITMSLTNSIIEMDNGIGEQNTLAAAASH